MKTLKKLLAGPIGWILFFGTFLCIALVLRLPFLADGLHWRFEQFEPRPKLSQRILERLSHKEAIWQDAFIADNAILIFGDSHLRLLPMGLLGDAYNFSIGGQSVGRLAAGFSDFKSVNVAALIVLNGGENDLSEGSSIEAITASWVSLVSKIPKGKNFLCIGMPETLSSRRDSQNVATLNIKIQGVCTAYTNGQYLPVKMGAGIFMGYEIAKDEVHISKEAMKVLANEIRVRAIAAKLSNV